MKRVLTILGMWIRPLMLVLVDTYFNDPLPPALVPRRGILVAVGSALARSFTSEHCIVGGVPAREIKKLSNGSGIA